MVCTSAKSTAFMKSVICFLAERGGHVKSIVTMSACDSRVLFGSGSLHNC